MSVVPVLDIAPFLAGSTTDKVLLAKKLDEVCRNVGFFCLTGHGVSNKDFREIYDVSKAFFHLDVEEKRRVAQRSPDVIRGYIGVGAAALGGLQDEKTPSDWKESFSAGPIDVNPQDPYYQAPLARGHFAPNRWPERPSEFGRIWMQYYAKMAKLSSDLMRLSAVALGLKEDFFADKIDRQIGILGAMYYPDQHQAPAPGQLRAGAHTDFDTMTILRPDDAPGGLQIKTENGDWAAIKAPPGAFVVNIGDLMARWTNDRWASTLHRVVNPPRDSKLGTERLSIGFFHETNFDTLIECLPGCQSPGEGAKYPPVFAGEHIYNQFSRQIRSDDLTDNKGNGQTSE